MNELNKNTKQFIIDVGEYLKLTTPYSDQHFIYDDINYCLDDLQYCLEVEVNNNGKKDEEIQR